jgi:uncharacterized SAM-binding protein YcdF (DUF218 family)
MKNKFFWILILAVVFFTRHYWLPLPGTLLIVPDRLGKADCIVLLRGDDYVRFKKSVELLNEGYSSRIVVSEAPGINRESRLIYSVSGLDKLSSKDLVLKYFEHFGKNPDGIIFTDSLVTSTFNEALATRTRMQKEGFKSLVLVTSEYHMRRALLIFKWAFRKTGIEIYHATAGSNYEPSKWWTREADVRRVAQEYGSYLVDFVYYGLDPAKLLQ